MSRSVFEYNHQSHCLLTIKFRNGSGMDGAIEMEEPSLKGKYREELELQRHN